MPSKIEETYCVQVGDVWCAVLGNHYPNFAQKVKKEDEFYGLVEGGLSGVFTGKDWWCTQRLCDQTNVQYKLVMLQAPTCPECLRIKQLMVEFARPEDQKEEEADERSAEPGDGGRSDAGEADPATAAIP